MMHALAAPIQRRQLEPALTSTIRIGAIHTSPTSIAILYFESSTAHWPRKSEDDRWIHHHLISLSALSIIGPCIQIRDAIKPGRACLFSQRRVGTEPILLLRFRPVRTGRRHYCIKGVDTVPTKVVFEMQSESTMVFWSSRGMQDYCTYSIVFLEDLFYSTLKTYKFSINLSYLTDTACKRDSWRSNSTKSLAYNIGLLSQTIVLREQACHFNAVTVSCRTTVIKIEQYLDFSFQIGRFVQ